MIVSSRKIQRDGMAAEFNIDPVTNFADFNRNIQAVMSQLGKFLPKGYTLKAIPSVIFEANVFEAAADDCKQLGCNPDWNAWTGEMNMPPHDPFNPYLRTASGHIHIGWTEGADFNDPQHLMNCNDLVKQLDWYLGGWSIKMDSDPTRRRMYGKAGACRYKDYGVEYRVLSNFWITTKERRLATWNRLQHAIYAMSNRYIPDKVVTRYCAELVNAINTCEVPPTFAKSFFFPLQTVDTSYARF